MPSAATAPLAADDIDPIDGLREVANVAMGRAGDLLGRVLNLFDIDHFKRVNDNYGHPVGDQVLRRVAEVVRHTARATDIAGRYGGEEFGLLLIETSERGALMMAERLRRMVAAESIETNAGAISITISLGIAELGSLVDNGKAWIECADQGLYAAKRGGRNQVVLYAPVT